MSELKHMHAKTECLPFNTEDVRLIITERYGKQEIRMHGEDARFIVEAIAAAKRRTQPEATKPAQDESDKDTWRRLALQFDGHRMQALHHLRAMLQDAQKHAPLAEAFLKAPPMDGEAVLAQRIAALASSSDALVAGDRVDVITDTQRMDFQQANPHMYFNVDKRGKRWRFGHFSNYPQDCYGSAREALDAAIHAQKDGHHE